MEQEQHPTTEIKKPIPKPMRSVQILLIALIVIVAIGAVLHIITSSGSASKPTPTVARIQTAGSDDVTNIQAREAIEAKKLEQQAGQVDSSLDDAMKGLKSLQDGGQAKGIPPMTDQQKRAMGQRTGGSGVSRADVAKQERKRKLEAALNSSSVAIDLPADQAHAQPQQEASAKPAVQQQPQQKADASVPSNEAKPDEYDFDSSTGGKYRLFEGNVIETVLTNRVNGAMVGPINCMVTTDVYSHNNQHLLIPQGTRILGSVTSVSSTSQQRLFVSFHRMIMPDGTGVSLDKFVGLDVVGQTGLRDVVNHHYLKIFGASLAIGAIGGIEQIGNGMNSFGYDPSVEFRNGISQQLGQESQQILNKFLNELPTFIIRERSRVKIYLSNDLTLPAYDKHSVKADL